MTSRSATRAAYHACSYGRPVAVLVRVSFSLLWHLQAKLTQPHPPCGVERNPCQPCKSSLVIRQNRGDGVKLSLVPLVIRRSLRRQPRFSTAMSTLEMRRVRLRVQETHRLLLAGLVHLWFLLHGTCYPAWLLAWRMGECVQLEVELHAKLGEG